jgi:hypothetical protein
MSGADSRTVTSEHRSVKWKHGSVTWLWAELGGESVLVVPVTAAEQAAGTGGGQHDRPAAVEWYRGSAGMIETAPRPLADSHRRLERLHDG